MESLKSINLSVGNMNLMAAISGQGKEALVAVKPLCEALGILACRQQAKLQKNPQFSCTHMYATGSDGKNYEMLCIPITEVGMWLCTISARKVKPEIREKLISFQRELQIVIYEAVSGTVTPAKFRALERALEQSLAQIAILTSEMQRLMVVQERFESSDKKAAASRLSNQRWAERDRSLIH